MLFFRLTLPLILAISLFAGPTPTAVTLSSSTNPSIFGSATTLTALVSPSAANGTITFYDGDVILETEPLSNGQAVLTTVLLPSGLRALTAYYSGDSNYSPSTSGPVAQYVTSQPQNGFAPSVGYGPPFGVSGQFSIAVGDFNGDGKPDLVFTQYFPEYPGYGVDVLLGNGDGTFQAPVTYPSTVAPSNVAVGDLNGDGKADLVVCDQWENAAILLGNGDGTFQAAKSLKVYLASAQVADFNGDGKADLVVVGNGIGVLFGNGDGTFQPELDLDPGMNANQSLVVGDFNGDGKPDLAITQTLGSVVDELVIILNNGDGTFQTLPPLQAPLNFFGNPVTADFNGDGNADLAFASDDYSQSTVAVLLGNGDGTFQSGVHYPSFSPFAVGDINGDGKVDIVTSGTSVFNFGVLYGNGDGAFQPPTYFGSNTGAGISGVQLADFRGDGLTDVVVAQDNVGVFLGQALPLCAAASPSSITLDANGGAIPINITVSSGPCAWNVSAPSWVLEPASGTESTTVTASIPPNATGLDLSGNINISIAGRLAYIIPVTERSAAEVFADVPPSDYYFDAVNLLYAKAITAGCSSNPLDFCPAESVTRAEMAIFIVRSVFGGDNFTAPTIPYFRDVEPADFGFAWIQEMAALGITTGCGNADFCPNDSVTRAETAIFIIRARYGARQTFDYNPTPFFSDVPADAFGFSWIQRMKMDNITSGCTPTTYCPDYPVTRGDMAIFIMRGGYNQLLPPGEPIISQINPTSIPLNQTTTVTVTGLNTNFVPGMILNPIPDVFPGAINVTSPTTFTVDLTPAPGILLVPLSIWISTGSQEAVLPNGLTLQ